MSKVPIKENEKRGLIAGYNPNRISLYIFLINCGRVKECMKIMWDDMEKYKIADEDCQQYHEDQDHEAMNKGKALDEQ
jgi:hypothetical protein